MHYVASKKPFRINFTTDGDEQTIPAMGGKYDETAMAPGESAEITIFANLTHFRRKMQMWWF
jgi:hypothetical protein